MARATAVPQDIIQTGLNPSFGAFPADGIAVPNNGKTYVEVVNGDVSEHTITVDHPGTVDGLAVANQTVAVPAGETRKIGPFGTRFNQGGTTDVHVDIEDNTSVTYGVFRLT